MKIAVKNLPDTFERGIEDIFQLFREEEDQLIYLEKNQKQEENTVCFTYTLENDKVKANVKAEVNNKVYTFTHHRAITNGLSEKEKGKITKQAVFYVWLQLLEAITGKEHEWGILTGIRPTKLYHQIFQRLSHEEVKQRLEADYLVKPEKTALLGEIVRRQLEVIPDLYQIDREVSLYLGIPFCPTKCAYCTFPAYAIHYKQGIVEQFLNGLLQEIDLIGRWIKESGIKVTTIYFGGGTPTSIAAAQLDQLLQRLDQWIGLEQVREVTVEAGRPDTITTDKLQVLKKWKVNRISINPQSFIQESLDQIGRHHTVQEVIDKYHLAKQLGMNNINMDLIIGLPGEGLQEFVYSLDQVQALQPESITIHTMAFKRASYLTKNKTEFAITEQAEIKKMMAYAKRWTKENGYDPYYLYRQKNMLGNLENIGYSLRGKESLYNILIMEEKQTIIGLGSGAVSKLISPKTGQLIRFPNPKEPSSYMKTIQALTNKKLQKLKELF